MRKRLIEAGIGLLGLVVIALAVASATLWRADDVLVARATATAGLVVTDPGVLELGGDPVTVRAQVPAGDHIVLAVGRDTDVSGWVGSDPYQRVSGLSGWRTLRLAAPGSSAAPSPAGSTSASASPSGGAAASSPSATAAAASAAPSSSASGAPGTAARPAADPSGSDMWVAQATGTGSAQLTWHAQDGRWSLLVAGIAADGSAVNPTLEMSWPRVVSSPWLVPGLVLGGLLLLAGAGLLGRDWWRTRAGHDGWTSVETGAVPEVLPAGAGAGAVLTRRQLRELQSRSGRPPTGAVQAVGSVDARAAARGEQDAATVPPTSTTQIGSPSALPGERSGTRPQPRPLPPVAGRLPGAPTARESSTPGGTPIAPQVRPATDTVTAADAARRAASAHGSREGAGPAPVGTPPAAVPSVAAPSHLGSAAGPPPAPPIERPAPPWAAGGRRARRAAAAQPELGTQPHEPTPHGVTSPGTPTPHEGRPAWAAPVPPDAAGARLVARSAGDAPSPFVLRPSGQRGPAAPARTAAGEPGAPGSQTAAGPARPGQPLASPRTAQPPRPGGWVPVPGAGESGVPADRGDRPGQPAAPRPPVHPSWLVSRPDEPPTRESAPSVGRPSTPPARSGDEQPAATDEGPEDSPSSRADAWRRAWGLPTEPPADDRGGEDR
ncbi:MAG: hypothetical protein BGO38_02140 [Cellulomonas sp. 73-145]|nr:MAG: hypothetical protein BGO38_02140 [Cellulomonas sp. 73-145]